MAEIKTTMKIICIRVQKLRQRFLIFFPIFLHMQTELLPFVPLPDYRPVYNAKMLYFISWPHNAENKSKVLVDKSCVTVFDKVGLLRKYSLFLSA